MALRIGRKSFNIVQQFGIAMKVMWPGNGHGCAEFTGANVEQSLRAALAAHRADRAETDIVGIGGRRVECVIRRPETVSLKN